MPRKRHKAEEIVDLAWHGKATLVARVMEG